MKDSGVQWIGQVPKHWEVCHLKRLVTINNGSDYKHCQIEPCIYPVIGSGGIFTYASSYIYDGEVLLLGRKGTIDKPMYYNGKFWTVDTMFYAVSNDNAICKYLYYHSMLIPFARFSTSTALPSMTQTDLKNNLICLPPLSEQRAIADWLDAKCADIDAAIELQQRMIDKLKAYKTAVIHQAVTKGLDKNANLKDSGVQWIGEVPAHWGIVNIGSLYNQRNEKVSDKDYKPLSVTKKGILPQLETAAKTDNGDNRKLVRKNDFAINSRSDRKGSCGISDYDGSVSLINIVLYPIQEIENRYYNWLFHSPEFAEEFYRLGHGIVADLWTTRWSEMKGMRILLPPTLAEQRAIADWLDAKCADIDATIALKEQKQEKLKAYKKTIIFEYVTGKKQVANINK
jgi:restriction modification system DNA specificity subunit